MIQGLIYRAYDLYNRFAITKYYKAVAYNERNNVIIDKSAIRDYLERHGFDSELSNNGLMTKADISERIKNVNPSDIFSFAYTGGSYGEPFKIPYSKQRSFIRTGAFRYYNEVAGYKLGEPFLFIAAKEKPQWWQFLRNEYRFVPKNLSRERVISILNLVRSKNIKTAIGFPSVVYEIAKIAAEEKISTPIRTIIFTSEGVDPNKRAFIEHTFKCNITERYSNEEVGLIGQQRNFQGVFYTNRYNVVVEILDPITLKPVEPGGMGKVVVTDIAADLVPIVRYDTGDLAVAHEYKDDQLVSLKSISGRVTEQIFTTAGAAVGSLAFGPLIHMPMTTEGYYNQFQFAQIEKAVYELRIKKDVRELPEEIVHNIESNLKNILGSDAEIRTVFLDDIVPQPSGKRPIYKNEWLTKQKATAR